MCERERDQRKPKRDANTGGGEEGVIQCERLDTQRNRASKIASM